MSDEKYSQIYDKDNPKTESYGWIQWKGTDVCLDVHCKCGHDGHVDGDFFYAYECPVCGTKYAVGAIVKLIPLDTEEAQYLESYHSFFSDNPED